MKRLILPAIAGLLMGACATNPDKITATPLSPNTWRGLDCHQLASEHNRLALEINTRKVQLADRANTDTWQAVGGFFVIVPWFFLDGDGTEAEEYARMKGQLQAVKSAAVQNGCSLPPPSQPASPAS